MSKRRERPTPALTLQTILQIAKEVALKNNGHVPMLVADDGKNPKFIHIDELMPTGSERQMQVFVIGFALALSGEVSVLQQAFLVSEAWMSAAAPTTDVQLPPSQDPNRKEVLIISGMKVPEQTVEVAILEMLRDKQGKLRQLQAFSREEEATEVDSPLLRAFVQGFLHGHRTQN